jgi:small subunit ribosomal protein S4e
MANKGETKCLKLQKAHKISGIDKTKRFLINPKPGKHNKSTAVSIGFVLRDILHLADNAREIKYIISNRELIVDKKKVSEHRLPVGLFDVIEIPKINKLYRVISTSNGSYSVKEITKDESNYKICKIVRKTVVKKGQIQLVTNDGRTILTTNKAYKAKASIKIDLIEGTIKEYYPLEKGSEILVISGKHVGEIGKITAVTPGTMQKYELIKAKTKSFEFETTEKNVIVIN